MPRDRESERHRYLPLNNGHANDLQGNKSNTHLRTWRLPRPPRRRTRRGEYAYRRNRSCLPHLRGTVRSSGVYAFDDFVVRG